MQTQHLGRLAVRKVMEMESGLPLQMIFPEVTAADLARLAGWYRDPNLAPEPASSSVVLSMHSFVVSLEGRNVLIDSCNGNCKRRSLETVHMLDTSYLANLEDAGFTPEDIDMVMCTHLHFDHVGWNTRLENGRWVPTFPNARYVFGKRDYEHWRAQEDIAPHREAFEDSVLPVVEAGLADIIDTECPTAAMQEVDDGIWLEPAFGHSPGCCTIHAKAGGAEAVFWGDVIHHPVQLIRPELTLMFDDDPLQAAKVRGALLERVADNDTMCFSAHFLGSSAGRVRRDGHAYRFAFVGE
jgi:glyoxylase-like metal-dependent hydrolase (beta-lactamase superfamily II)